VTAPTLSDRDRAHPSLATFGTPFRFEPDTLERFPGVLNR